MTVTFVGPEEFHVVEPARLAQQNWQPALLAPLIVWEPGWPRAYVLLPREAARLLVLIRGGESVDAALSTFPAVPVIEPGNRPADAAFVVEAGDPAGAWLPADLADGTALGREARGGGGAAMPAPTPFEWGSEEAPAADEAAASEDAGEVSEQARPQPPSDQRRSARRGLFRGLRQGLIWRGSNGAKPAQAGDPTIRRTPHLDAPKEIATAPDTTFTVAVRTDSQPFSAEESGTEVRFEVPPKVRRIEVGVLLLVSEHFNVDGAEYRSLVIDRDRPASDPIEFQLRVAEHPPDRPASVQALFLYRGRSCGQVTREWDWHKDSPTAQAVQPRAEAPASMPVHVDAEAPDLSVFITAPVADGMHFHCAIETPLLSEYEQAQGSEFGLPEKADVWVKRKLGRLTDEGLSDSQRREALEEIGQQLFEASPPLFRKVLWRLIDEGRPPKSIYIASVEPTLPWELMIPNRPPDTQPDVLKPLGVEFAVGRWTREDSKAPPQMMPIRDSLVVAPVYEGDRALDSQKEVELIKERLNGTELQPATRNELQLRCRQAPMSLLHLVCHGQADVEEEDAVMLDGGELLTSGNVQVDAVLRRWCTERAPFIFINACEAGRLVRTISGGAGFPRAFASIGARAIVAPLWPVSDVLAGDVAAELYTTALEEDAPPIAEILRGIRERAYTQLDADTFAAYCFYGDPLAKLQLESGADGDTA